MTIRITALTAIVCLWVSSQVLGPNQYGVVDGNTAAFLEVISMMSLVVFVFFLYRKKRPVIEGTKTHPQDP